TGDDHRGAHRRFRDRRFRAMTAESPLALAWRRFRRDAWAVGGLGFLLLLMLAAIVSPWLIDSVLHSSAYRLGVMDHVSVAGRSVEVVDKLGIPIGPCASYPLGADLLGRDVLARMLLG